jgi:drug/metabolite transporter (DMT)-like permease
MASLKDYLKIHLIVFIWGFTAILGLLISLQTVEMVFYRTLIAAIGTAILLLMRKKSFQLAQGDLIKVVATGAIIAAHWILFFLSARLSNASVSLVGFATVALWTSFIDPIVNKKKIRIYEVLLGLMVILGLYVIFRNEVDHALGLMVGVLSGLFAAIFSVINARLTKRISPYQITFYEMSGAWLSIALFLPIYSYFIIPDVALTLVPSITDWFYLLVLGIVCTVFAFSMWVELLKRVTVFAANLSINLEPIYGIVLALIFFPETEKMRAGFYLGSLIIIASVLAFPLIRAYEKNKIKLSQSPTSAHKH